MDLQLETPSLSTAQDARAVIAAAGDSVKTLAVGPWGSTEAGEDDGRARDAADVVLEAVVGCSATWSSWPLKSFSVCELRLRTQAGLTALSAALRALPSSTSSVRLSRLGLGKTDAYGECLSALASRRLQMLDLSGNGLDDGHVLQLLPVLPRLVGLNLSANASVTAASVTQLLASEGALRLERLDLSECSVGAAGVVALARHLRLQGCALRELTAYRAGLRAEDVCALTAAAAQAPAMRAVNVVGNAHHTANWAAVVGQALAASLSTPAALRVVTVSCPERELEAAKKLFADGPVRVILVPNEQNNYNRALFLGD